MTKQTEAQSPLPEQEPVADVRGLLAARLTCWHRLTGAESDELVALFQALPVQEPEWYHGVDQHGCNRFYHKTEVRPREFSTPLYTTPPQRPWVGLTDEEISACSKGNITRNGFARNVLAKSKEKNA